MKGKRMWFTAAIAMMLAVIVAHPALAASKPPAKFCFQLSSFEMAFALVVKKAGGTLKMQDGKLKVYSVHGAYYHGDNYSPVAGTGYMLGETFSFSVQGVYYKVPNVYKVYVKGSYDVNAQTVSVHGEDTAMPSAVFGGTVDLGYCGEIGLPVE